MTMVHRVARAICNSAGADVFDELDPMGIHYALYMQQALDALKAMREPTEEIENADTDFVCAGNIWQSMIDAAIAEHAATAIGNRRA